LSLFISKEARKARRIALKEQLGASRVQKRHIELQEYQERAKAARARARLDREGKTCGNCANFSGHLCNQVDFEMPEGMEGAGIKPSAPAKAMCDEEYWEPKERA
jgi:hypothetical protein